MKTILITKSIEIEGATLRLDCDGDGNPDEVTIEMDSGTCAGVLKVELLERVIAALQEHGGYIGPVCADHGRYKIEKGTYDCPTCAAEKAQAVTP